MNDTEATVLASLFSSAVIKQMARGKPSLFASLLWSGGMPRSVKNASTIGQAFDAAFTVLSRPENRNEYVYRTSILEACSRNGTSVLHEIRAGASKADMVVLDDFVTAIEIKTERDSLSRLAGQLEDYARVFPKVSVVTYEKHLPKVIEKVGDSVGIQVLHEDLQIETVRDPVARPEHTRPIAVLDWLRAGEAAEILKDMGQSVPNVPNTQRYDLLKKRFARLDPLALQSRISKIVSRSRNPFSEDNFQELPISLRAGAIMIPMSRKDRARLIAIMLTVTDTSLSWF